MAQLALTQIGVSHYSARRRSSSTRLRQSKAKGRDNKELKNGLEKGFVSGQSTCSTTASWSWQQRAAVQATEKTTLITVQIESANITFYDPVLRYLSRRGLAGLLTERIA